MVQFVAAAVGVVMVVAAAAIVAGLIYQRVGLARDARRQPVPGRAIDIGGRRLHIYCVGEGPISVVFEAGIASSSLNWRPVQERLTDAATAGGGRDDEDGEARVRACAYDRAGYGWSDRAGGRRGARESAADLHRLLHAAGIPPPYILVAHSFGAYVVALFTAAHPDEVAGMVLVDPLTVEEWLVPGRGERRMLIGGQLFSWIGAGLARIGIVRFLLQRTGGSREPGGRPSTLPSRVLRLFGHDADVTVRRVVGEVTKLPPELWPAVKLHWSRARSFLAMAQHFRTLPHSAAEVHAVLAPPPRPRERPHRDAGPHHDDGPRHDDGRMREACVLQDIPVVVISAANCGDERLRLHRLLANLSRQGAHVHATNGGHWIHLDDPPVVIEAIRRVAAARQAQAG